MRVYLAGKMQGRMGWEVLAERAHATDICESFDLEVIDPAATELIEPECIIDTNMTYITMKAFVSKDEFAIRQCHALLVLTGDISSDGTSWEMGLAHYGLGIPVFVVAPDRVSGKKMGFTNIKADAIFATVEDAAEFIAENYNR